MLNPISRNEIRLLRADGGYWLAIALLGAFLAYGFYTGALWLHELRDKHDAFIAAQQAPLDDLTNQIREYEAGKRESTAARMPYAPRGYAALPPSPYLPLSIGQADLLPMAANVSLFSTPGSVMVTANIRNPAALSEGHFDPAFVLVFLYPLALLALGYNVLSAEREQGTLALALANPVSLPRLLFSRLWVRVMAVTLPVLLFMLAGLLLTGGPFAWAADGMRFLLLAAAIIIYGAFWLALVAIVNCTRWSSATNAVVLGSLWLVFTAVAPGLLSLGSEVLYPLPARGDLVNEARLVLVEAEKRGEGVIGDLLQLHPELKRDSNEETLVPASTLEYYAVVQRADAEQASSRAAFAEAVSKRETFVNRLSAVSPAVLFRRVLNQLAGTGPDRFRGFESQTLAFLAKWHETFAPRMFRGPALGLADYEAMPAFLFAEEPIAGLAVRTAWPLLFLLAVTAAVLAVAGARLRRYELAG